MCAPYTVMIHKNYILDFPNPRKLRVDIVNNWLYQVGIPYSGNSAEEEGEPDFTNHSVGIAMEEDIVPPPTLPTKNEVGSSNENKDRWEWVHPKIMAWGLSKLAKE